MWWRCITLHTNSVSIMSLNSLAPSNLYQLMVGINSGAKYIVTASWLTDSVNKKKVHCLSYVERQSLCSESNSASFSHFTILRLFGVCVCVVPSPLIHITHHCCVFIPSIQFIIPKLSNSKSSFFLLYSLCPTVLHMVLL